MKAPYASHWKRDHPEAYQIWLSRDNDPAPVGRFGLKALQVVDDEDDKSRVLLSEVLAIAERRLSRKQLCVLRWRLNGLSLDEVACILMVSRERVSQIEKSCLMRLMALVRKIAAPPWAESPEIDI